MGVTYKLKDEVVHYIISQRQSNPLASCRQLAESTSQKFGLQLSKSSVHDVLKESGIITPRGRKPKDKFEIPQEKKKQIQVSLSQVKLIPPPVREERPQVTLIADVITSQDPVQDPPPEVIALPSKKDFEVSSEYEGAGRIFLKAALWDLGIFKEEDVKAEDWNYYLTYSKGIRVVLENDKSFFIDLPLPLERCIREAADGLINNVRLLIVDKVSDEDLFRACMEVQSGFKISNILIVDENDHILFELKDIVEYNRDYTIKYRVFVESLERDVEKRLRMLFFPQLIDNANVVDNILNLKGFNTTNKNEITTTLLISDAYDNRLVLEEAAKRLNEMYIYDEQDRLVKVKIQ
jgi:hypothetical protein